jgi:hypothetical protein
VVQELRRAALKNLRRNTLIGRQLQSVISALETDGVRPLVLKGLALAGTVYPESDSRPVGDIDLLVLPRDLTRAREILEGSGYHPAARYFDAAEDLYCQEDLVPSTGLGRRVRIDLHWRLHRMLGLTPNPPTEELVDRAVTVDTPYGSMRTLHPVDALIHSAFHVWLNHRMNLRLIWISDLALLARALRSGGHWEALRERSGEACARMAAVERLRMAEKWFGLRVPPEYRDLESLLPPSERERALLPAAASPGRRAFDVLRLYWPRHLPPLRQARLVGALLFPPPDVLKSRYPGTPNRKIPLRYAQRWIHWFKHVFIRNTVR